MKYSIIIPTYNHCEDLLKPCLESIFKFTEFSNTEIIVVANGCTDTSFVYLNSLYDKPYCRFLWFDEPLGYTKATNEGIKVANGEYLILLNNDTILLPQPKNIWIDLLEEPFSDKNVGLTGPMKAWCQHAQNYFLIFFCVMIKKQVFDDVGFLDEIFSPGFGEDTDFCIKAQRYGWKIIQVPGELLGEDQNQKVTKGLFPIFHKGEATFEEIDNGNELLKRNRKYLKYRYGADEYKRLNLGCGDWHFDTHINIDQKEPCDIQLDVTDLSLFLDNSVDEIFASHVLEHISPYKVHEVLREWRRVLKPNARLIIDVPNIEATCKAFIESNDKARKYQLLNAIYGQATPSCPHVWGWYDEILTDHLVDAGFYNFHVNKNDLRDHWAPNLRVECQKAKDYDVYDCFLFHNELDLLEIRLNELKDVVDYFVIVESLYTHAGEPKPLYFDDNKKRYKEHAHKIIHIVDDYVFDDSWSRERHQRDKILDAFKKEHFFNDNDRIIIGDADEIPSPQAILNYKPERGLCAFEQYLHYYTLNCREQSYWDWQKILTYKQFKNMTPCEIRYTPWNLNRDSQYLKNGGWHFSFLGDTDAIIKKIESWSHQEYNRDDIKNKTRIEKILEEGKDVFGREELKFKFVEIDETYPKYVLNNIDKFKSYIRYQHLPDGWFNDNSIQAYRTLIQQLPNNSNILEIGIWQGRSICSIADLIKEKNLIITAIDHFRGSESEKETQKEASEKDLKLITENNFKSFGISDNVTIIQEDSNTAHSALQNEYFDLIFIDGDHLNLRNDIINYRTKLKNTGILCGHDFYWKPIKDVLHELYNNMYSNDGDIWFVMKKEKHATDVSIIIPTYNNCDELLKPCIESIIKYTNFDNKELIVVANGCTDNTIEYLTSIKDIPIHILDYDNALGFAKAVNAGIKTAKGNYIVLLNNDTVLLEQQVDSWITLLMQPFYQPNNIDVGITGPLKGLNAFNKKFLIFFCVMIKRAVINKIGYLDESFLVGGAEDMDFCYRAEEAGFTLMQVPTDDELELKDEIYLSHFPIYHKAEATVNDIANWNSIFESNVQKFKEKYEPTVEDFTDYSVTATISTKDRYFDTLPLTITSICNQTMKPVKLLLYDDGEQIDLREHNLYQHIFSLLDRNNITWEVLFGKRMGQVANHQQALNDSKTEFIWRLDDDHVAEHNVLSTLIDTFVKERDTGAVGGLVVQPKESHLRPKIASNKIEDIYLGLNIQWFLTENKELEEVDHLYSSFLFKKSAANNYSSILSQAGHREETMFTYDMKRKGHKIFVNPNCITWHFQNDKGGIRSASTEANISHDEAIFNRYLVSNNIKTNSYKFIVLDSGIGDHFAFKNCLNDIRQKYFDSRIIIAACYNEVFEDCTDIELISIADAKLVFGNIDSFNIYKFMIEKDWKNSLAAAYKEMYV